MSVFKVGDRVTLLPNAYGSTSMEEVERILERENARNGEVFVIQDTDYTGDGDFLIQIGTDVVWVFPEFLQLYVSGDMNTFESKIRRAIDFLEVDWESADVDRVLKLAKELI